MNISAINGNSGTTNFKAAYGLQGVNINGQYFGQKNKAELYNVASAFSDGLRNNTLSNEVRALADKFFRDYKYDPFFMVARTNGVIYNQRIMLLSSNDAYEYKNVCMAENDPDVKTWCLNRIFYRNKGKKLILSADMDKDGNITITNIEKVKKNASV